MKLQTLALLAVVPILIWGCGESKTEDAAQPPTGTGAATMPAAPKGASLGSEGGNDHFTITLTAVPSDLKVGKAKFIAKVLHHGQPTDGAMVKLSLSMPSMNMGGPEVELKHTKDGIYAGEADLSMGGDWQAKVSVEQEDHPGEAVYDFVVAQ